MDDMDNHMSQAPSTAASLLTQLSGQLQQLTSSNLKMLPKLSPNSDNHIRNESAEFDLPAPPSPDVLDIR